MPQSLGLLRKDSNRASVHLHVDRARNRPALLSLRAASSEGPAVLHPCRAAIPPFGRARLRPWRAAPTPPLSYPGRPACVRLRRLKRSLLAPPFGTPSPGPPRDGAFVQPEVDGVDEHRGGVSQTGGAAGIGRSQACATRPDREDTLRPHVGGALVLQVCWLLAVRSVGETALDGSTASAGPVPVCFRPEEQPLPAVNRPTSAGRWTGLA